MSKRIALSILIGLLLSLLVVTVVYAGATNGIYLDWTWQGDKSGYFMPTDSGLVHLWSYDRPSGSVAPGDVHFIYKPHDKFPNATCDVGAVHQNANWKARNLNNILDSGEKLVFLTIFPDLDKLYLVCAYQIE